MSTMLLYIWVSWKIMGLTPNVLIVENWFCCTSSCPIFTRNTNIKHLTVPAKSFQFDPAWSHGAPSWWARAFVNLAFFTIGYYCWLLPYFDMFVTTLLVKATAAVTVRYCCCCFTEQNCDRADFPDRFSTEPRRSYRDVGACAVLSYHLVNRHIHTCFCLPNLLFTIQLLLLPMLGYDTASGPRKEHYHGNIKIRSKKTIFQNIVQKCAPTVVPVS